MVRIAARQRRWHASSLILRGRDTFDLTAQNMNPMRRTLLFGLLAWTALTLASRPITQSLAAMTGDPSSPYFELSKPFRVQRLEGFVAWPLILSGIAIAIFGAAYCFRSNRKALARLHVGQLVLLWVAVVALASATWYAFSFLRDAESQPPLALAITFVAALVGVPTSAMVFAFASTWSWFGARTQEGELS